MLLISIWEFHNCAYLTSQFYQIVSWIRQTSDLPDQSQQNTVTFLMMSHPLDHESYRRPEDRPTFTITDTLGREVLKIAVDPSEDEQTVTLSSELNSVGGIIQGDHTGWNLRDGLSGWPLGFDDIKLARHINVDKGILYNLTHLMFWCQQKLVMVCPLSTWVTLYFRSCVVTVVIKCYP